MKCRFCREDLQYSFLDLGFAPPSNAYRSVKDLAKVESYFPLRVKVCDRCWLVQTEDYIGASELFKSDYAYFSSTSKSWSLHVEQFVETVSVDLGLTSENFVVEIASNDGCLLKHFVKRQIPCLGIEPTTDTAGFAESLGVPVLQEFFGKALADRLVLEGRKADLIIGNNVLAHVPDINDFSAGLKKLLNAEGTISLEFPHLMRMVEGCQFDTVYHEHFSYLSLTFVKTLFNKFGLRIFDVEELATHGGSLRVFVCHCDDLRETKEVVGAILIEETRAGLCNLETYSGFQASANAIKNNLLKFLIEKKIQGRKVVAYGAAAKGNTLLNYAGVKVDLLPAVFDAADAKQGKFLPGSHIPIFAPSGLYEMDPDYVLLLPWNLGCEIKEQLSKHLPNAQFLVAVPELQKI